MPFENIGIWKRNSAIKHANLESRPNEGIFSVGIWIDWCWSWCGSAPVYHFVIHEFMSYRENVELVPKYGPDDVFPLHEGNQSNSSHFSFNQWDATRFPVLNLSFRVTPRQQKVLKTETAKETNMFSWFTSQLVYQKLSSGDGIISSRRSHPREADLHKTSLDSEHVASKMNLHFKPLHSSKKQERKKKKIPLICPCIKRYWNRRSLRHPEQLHVWRLLGSLGGHRSPRQTGRLQARCRLVYSKKAADWDLFGSGWTSVFPGLIPACNSV